MNIFKTKIVPLFILGISSFSFGQFQYGVKAGVGISNTTIVHGISKERVGLLAGFIAKYQLSSRSEEHYLQAEVLYTNQGEFTVDRSGNKFKAFVDYINIPIMYKYYFDDSGSDFFLEGGPQLGFKIADNIDLLGPDATNNVLKSFDLAFNLGVGYSLQRKYEVNLRYVIGLVDTYDYLKWDNDINRTSLISLGITYYFN